MFVITSMKVIAVNVVVLAGVAQAAVQGDLQNEHGMFDMGGLNVVEMMGAQQQPNIQQIIKKASCALPCLLNSWDELPCSGKSPLKTICSNTNKIKRSVTPCANKCGFSNDAINSIDSAAKKLCKLQYSKGKDNYGKGKDDYGKGNGKGGRPDY